MSSSLHRIAHHQQHHRLPPAVPSAGNTGIPPHSVARLGELFDLIKTEFESVAQDSSLWKVERDEYEKQSELICLAVS